jgi:hypothetical protein
MYDGDDTTQVFLGNPGLKPYYLNALHLDYEFFTPEKFYAGLSLRHNFANNAIVRKKYLENGIHYTTYVNVSNYSVYSISLNCNFDITKWWKVSLNGLTVFKAYKDADAVLNKKYTAYSVWFSNTIQYKSLWTYFSYFPAIRNPTLTGYYTRDEYSHLTISYRRKPWAFAIKTFYMFSPVVETTETYSDGFSQIYTQNNKNQHFRVTFQVNYYLQKGTQKSDKQQRSRQYDVVK